MSIAEAGLESPQPIGLQNSRSFGSSISGFCFKPFGHPKFLKESLLTAMCSHDSDFADVDNDNNE